MSTFPELEVSKKRFESEMAAVDEAAIVLLKGHLLIVEALTRIIHLHLFHPEHLGDGILRFFQKSSLARSLCLRKSDLGEWSLIHAINSLRNTVSHALHSPERDKRMVKLRHLFFKEAPDSAQKEELRTAPDVHVVAAACAHCCGFLASFEADARAYRQMIHAMDRSINPDQPEFRL